MHGSYRQSTAQRITLMLGNFAGVVAVAWLLFGGGLERFSRIPGNYDRRLLLLACSAFYAIKFVLTVFVLIRRTIDWPETFAVVPWMWIIHITFAVTGGTRTAPLGFLDAVGIGLYLEGAYLNSASEFQRTRWKQNPAHQGKLYTDGLFRHAMHINYLGESVFFTGFALITHNVYSLLIPAVMILGFVYMHIPTLDRYLRDKYPEQFEAYAARTKKFVPFLY